MTPGHVFLVREISRARGRSAGAIDTTIMVIDPPALQGRESCAIVLAGRAGDHGIILADRTTAGPPEVWSGAVVAAAAEFQVSAVLAEDGPGIERARALLASAGLPVPLLRFRLPRGRRARAERVASLYERDMVIHCRGLDALERELLEVGGQPFRWLERADAAVAALTSLLFGDPAIQAETHRPRRW